MKTEVIYWMMWGMCLITVLPGVSFGAVGCTLNDPDRDIRRIFPEATGYKTEFITIEERGGAGLMKRIEERLGDKLDNVFETVDVPYAYYTVLKGKEVIGRVHGVNQKGTYGGMQLIIATDMEGVVVDFYYQKLSSPEAKTFRGKEFTGQFKGLCLSDFPDGVAKRIKDPSQKSADDFKATLRGIKKNLILLDEFKLENKHMAKGKDVAHEDVDK